MSYFIYILLNNVVPLSLMIAVGVLLQLIFKLDIRTLSKLNFYLFSPSIMFLMLYESAISLAIM
ncbi:MAG: transporter, partial [Paenibacillus sp.]|nr:transporter [Paenibacillus sp.]